MRFLSIVILTFLTAHLAAQVPLNEVDPRGRKHGKWILYLDKSGKKVKDSTTAAFRRFTYYDHGVHLQPMGRFCGKGDRMTGFLPGKGLITLHGEYRIFSADDRLVFVHIFENGEYIAYREFNPQGQLISEFDYTRHAAGQRQSWYYRTFNRKGELTSEGYVMKDEKGRWPPMRG